MNKGVKIALSILVVGVTATTLFFVLKRARKYSCKNSFLFLGNSITANSYGYVEMLQNKCPNARIKKYQK